MQVTGGEVAYDQDGIVLICGKCEDVLPSFGYGQFDHMITDPPYSQEHTHGKKRFGADMPDGRNRTLELGFDAITPELMERIASEATRLIGRWVLTFSDVEIAHEWRQAYTRNNLDYVRTGAWIKIGATPQFSGDRPASGFEAITIVHRRGKKQWNGGGQHAVWSEPIVLDRGTKWSKQRVHATQKPEPLMRKLIALFTNPGDTIVDPFAGSATTLRAARALGRRAVGIEMNRLNVDNAIKLLGQSAMDLGVFDEGANQHG